MIYKKLGIFYSELLKLPKYAFQISLKFSGASFPDRNTSFKDTEYKPLGSTAEMVPEWLSREQVYVVNSANT